ncbi:MAG: hypothetical protein AAF539_06595 [Planctomycetota bacterium]
MANHIRNIAGSLLALMTLGGCAGIYDCCYEKTQTLRAFNQYLECGKPECSCYPHDYKCGWIDGFYTVSTGGGDCPPAIAPAKYWKPGQIIKDCDNRRHAYYSGWQDGAARASQFPDTHTIRIYETCECPFPKCEKPCGLQPCRPCGMSSMGMPVSEGLIEMPMAEPAYATPMPHATTADPQMMESRIIGMPSAPPAPAGDAAPATQAVPAPVAEPVAPNAPAAAEIIPPSAAVVPDYQEPAAPKPISPMVGDFSATNASLASLRFESSQPIGQAIDYHSTPEPIRPKTIPVTDSVAQNEAGLIRMAKPQAANRKAGDLTLTLHSEMIESDSIVKLARPIND